MLINITNNWNIRHIVYASGLVVSVGDDDYHVNDSATFFDNQQLIPLGGTTQFQAYFDIPQQDRSSFTMQYIDPVDGKIYDVTVPWVG